MCGRVYIRSKPFFAVITGKEGLLSFKHGIFRYSIGELERTRPSSCFRVGGGRGPVATQLYRALRPPRPRGVTLARFGAASPTPLCVTARFVQISALVEGSGGSRLPRLQLI